MLQNSPANFVQGSSIMMILPSSHPTIHIPPIWVVNELNVASCQKNTFPLNRKHLSLEPETPFP